MVGCVPSGRPSHCHRARTSFARRYPSGGVTSRCRIQNCADILRFQVHRVLAGAHGKCELAEPFTSRHDPCAVAHAARAANGHLGPWPSILRKRCGGRRALRSASDALRRSTTRGGQPGPTATRVFRGSVSLSQAPQSAAMSAPPSASECPWELLMVMSAVASARWRLARRGRAVASARWLLARWGRAVASHQHLLARRGRSLCLVASHQHQR